MESKKQVPKKTIKSRLSKNKKRIFVGIWILFTLTAMLGFYDNFYMRFWSDFFLSIFLLILWLWFFPFTYRLQEKLFWKSLFSASLFTSTMFLVFIISSFSILLSVFQWDLTITIRSVLYFLTILLWRSSVLPITVVKRKKYVWKNISLLRKWIFIFFIVFGLSALTFDLVPYLNWSSNSETNDKWYTISQQNNSKHCYASKQKLHNDDRISAYIAFPNNGWKVEQDSFSIDDVKALDYFIEGKSTDKQYYFNREVCNTTKDTTILPIMYAGWMPVEEIYPGAEWGSVNNMSSFSNLDFEIWDYALNIFVSDNDSDRSFVKTLSFSVGQ